MKQGRTIRLMVVSLALLLAATRASHAQTPPAIVTQPQSQLVYAGSNVTFSVTATGDEALAYQWQFLQTNITRATNALLTLAKVNPTNTGDYTVVVSNLYGCVTSATAALTVFGPSLSTFAIAVKSNLSFNGTAIYVDSYDSSDMNYSTQGLYDPTKAKDHGDIGSKCGIVGIGNGRIKGRIHLGVTGSVSIGPNASVGDAAWVNGGNTGIKPGWLVSDMIANFPDVNVPFSLAIPPISGNINGTNYDYVLGSHNYVVSSLNGSVLVFPGATANLYVRSNASFSSITLTPGAVLKVYIGGPSASAVGPSSDGNPYDFQIWGLSSLTNLNLTGSNSFAGVIYAPNADMTINAGPGLVGAIVVKSLAVNGDVSFHLDENLARVLSWSLWNCVLTMQVANQVPCGNTAQAIVLANYPDRTVDATTYPETRLRSSDTNVITVEGNGLLTAHNLGSAVITARFGGQQVSNTVAVTPPLIVVRDADEQRGCGFLGDQCHRLRVAAEFRSQHDELGGRDQYARRRWESKSRDSRAVCRQRVLSAEVLTHELLGAVEKGGRVGGRAERDGEVAGGGGVGGNGLPVSEAVRDLRHVAAGYAPDLQFHGLRARQAGFQTRGPSGESNPLPMGKSATRQVWKPALPGRGRPGHARR